MGSSGNDGSKVVIFTDPIHSGARMAVQLAADTYRARKRRDGDAADALFRDMLRWANENGMTGSKLILLLVIIAASVPLLAACSPDATHPCRGPYGEPCGGPRSGWPGAATCQGPNCLTQ